MSEKRIELVRGLGPWAAVAIVVGTIIGTGIFLKPGEMAAVGGSVSVVYAAWIVGGLLSLFGALSFAELGAAIPEAGGQYAYLTKGLGPVWGFLFGWMHSTVGESSSAASIAAAFARFSSFFIPVIAAPIFTWHVTLPFADKPYEFVFSWAQPVAVVAIVLFTFINYLGVRLGGQVQIALTFLKIGAVLSIVVAGFWLGHGSLSHFHPFWPAHAGAGTFASFLAALAAALWVYDGWEDLNRVGSEVQNPERNFPIAMVGGTIFVAAVFLLFSAVCFYALPFASVAASSHIASDVVESFAGHGAAFWITLAMVISSLGTLNSSLLSGARVPYAMGRDGLFFRITAIVHPKFRTPSGALLFQGTLAALMALTGTFEELTSLYIFAGWIFYALSVVAMFRLRRTQPDMPRPFRTWGYPVVPGLFVLSALALTVNIWMERPVRSSIGLLLILAGLFFYRHWRTKVSADSMPA
ncbi:MAG TPA: amino acid permease [Candidatus Acidoferrales bacterium]|nr:amino acid permease [Candidatus Acidoferrales bacterium]